MDVFWSWPPVTRTLVAGSLITSVLAYGGLIPFYPLVFIQSKILAFPPELWRLVTSFLVTGPQLGIIFDPYFLYQYGSQLELGSPRFSGPGDFFTYIVFNGLIIIALAGYLLHGVLFLGSLIMAIMYTFAQDNPNRQVTFFVITIPAKYLPYLMILVTFVLGGPPQAMIQGTGIISAHLYDFLTRIWPTFGGGRNVIVTPRFVRDLFSGGGVRPAPQTRAYGTAQAAPTGEARSTGSSWSNQRGPGRRLGSN